MKDLDEELIAAVEDSEASAPDDGGVVTPVLSKQETAPAGNSKRNLGVLAALLVIGGGVLTLVMSSAGEASQYALDVDKFLAAKEKYGDRTVRVQGYLTKGSLLKRETPCEFRFEIYDVCAANQPKRQELSVSYPQCIVPDTFQDRPEANVEVTAVGRLSPDGTYLEATQIMAKCPSKYDEQGKAKAPRPEKCDER
jgi:cytochrome c-type biogenesis protein CcmE